MTIQFRPLCASLAAALLLAGCATRPSAPIELNVVGMNDFHGHLEGGKFTYTSTGSAQSVTVQAGGIGRLGGALKAWRAEDPELMLVAAGDLIGASPAISQMWADEPTLTALDMLGLRASAAGNHEFDNGRAELLRQQNGGCTSVRPDRACKFTPDYRGVNFRYLAANVLDSATGKTLLPAYRIEQAKGVKVAFIGAVLRNTPGLVLPSGVAGLSFTDEADAINGAVRSARAEGAKVFVVLIHEGGHTDEAYNQPDCKNLKGPIVGIAERLDPAIRLIVSGHTHRGFQCKVGERTITQAEMGGHVLSRIRLLVDPVSHAVRNVSVKNEVMQQGAYPEDPVLAAYLASIKARSDVALARPVAKLAASPVTRKQSPGGESALGDLVADAMLDAARVDRAQISLMNPAGLRRDLEAGADMSVTLGQVQAVLPFSNTLVTMDLSGAQVQAVLEQQWKDKFDDPARALLQVGRGLSYQWSAARPKGARIVPGSLKLNGKAIDPAATYRVVVNNFIAEGGDGFTVLKEGTNVRDTGIRDLDSFIDYLARSQKAGAPAGTLVPEARVTRVD
ncbi:MAG: bifunctional metallophosphatase/5'-nucleotidase [Pseudomonadota bacterium]